MVGVSAGMKITAYDHVGLRVTNAARSLAFYEMLGFSLDKEHSTQSAVETVSAAGVRLNLILDGEPTPRLHARGLHCRKPVRAIGVGSESGYCDHGRSC